MEQPSFEGGSSSASKDCPSKESDGSLKTEKPNNVTENSVEKCKPTDNLPLNSDVEEDGAEKKDDGEINQVALVSLLFVGAERDP